MNVNTVVEEKKKSEPTAISSDSDRTDLRRYYLPPADKIDPNSPFGIVWRNQGRRADGRGTNFIEIPASSSKTTPLELRNARFSGNGSYPSSPLHQNGHRNVRASSTSVTGNGSATSHSSSRLDRSDLPAVPHDCRSQRPPEDAIELLTGLRELVVLYEGLRSPADLNRLTFAGIRKMGFQNHTVDLILTTLAKVRSIWPEAPWSERTHARIFFGKDDLPLFNVSTINLRARQTESPITPPVDPDLSTRTKAKKINTKHQPKADAEQTTQALEEHRPAEVSARPDRTSEAQHASQIEEEEGRQSPADQTTESKESAAVAAELESDPLQRESAVPEDLAQAEHVLLTEPQPEVETSSSTSSTSAKTHPARVSRETSRNAVDSKDPITQILFRISSMALPDFKFPYSDQLAISLEQIEHSDFGQKLIELGHRLNCIAPRIREQTGLAHEDLRISLERHRKDLRGALDHSQSEKSAEEVSLEELLVLTGAIYHASHITDNLLPSDKQKLNTTRIGIQNEFHMLVIGPIAELSREIFGIEDDKLFSAQATATLHSLLDELNTYFKSVENALGIG